MLKSHARKLFCEKRKQVTEQQVTKWEDLILIQFQQLRLPHIHTLFTYASKEGEVHTDVMVDYLQFRYPALEICYPVCDFEEGSMSAVLTHPDTAFVENKYGIPEPADTQNLEIVSPQKIDLIIVPLLCFDESGNRVGYGKGFYDKFLSGVRSDAIKVGLTYFDPVDKIEDTNNFDVPLDYCITPERMYEF